MSGEAPWKDVLQLRTSKDHFVVTIESTGAMPPEDLLGEALQVLQTKHSQCLHSDARWLDVFGNEIHSISASCHMVLRAFVRSSPLFYLVG